jgi:hypothetical protein
MISFNELGWVFVYICSFGISDLIVNKYIKKTSICVIYYIFLGIVGCCMIYYPFFI